MATQGRVLLESEVRSIAALLESTDLTIPTIAERKNCSRSAVIAINRRFQVRDYAGRGSAWRIIGSDTGAEQSAVGTTSE